MATIWGWIGRTFDASTTWDDIAWVRRKIDWTGPTVVKGILDLADAREAAQVGVDKVSSP